VDVVKALIWSVNFERSVFDVLLDLGTLAGDAGATPRQDVLPNIGPDVFWPQLLTHCFTSGMHWIVNDGEDFLP
jgi:hypothetical protein